MKIGMLLSSAMALGLKGDGRRAQAIYQMEALRELGHEVIELNSWHPTDLQELDVVHFFEAGMGNMVQFAGRSPGAKLVAMAAFIDSNQPFFTYKIASHLHLGSRLLSVQYVLRRQVANSDVVVVRSSHERDRMVKSLGARPEQIVLALNGVNPPLEADPEGVRRRLGLPAEFVLHVGTYTQERKNVLNLLRAIKPLGYPLVLAGTMEEGPIASQIKAQAAGDPGLRLLSFVDAATLRGLYAACKVFALPSVHEGTGLVALEAASYGAPVVITRRGGPPDYFGGLAELVDPFDVKDIRRGLQRAWEQPRRSALQEHVIRNLSWKASAAALIAGYTAARKRVDARGGRAG